MTYAVDGDKSKLLLAVNGEVTQPDGQGGAYSRRIALDTIQSHYGTLPPEALTFESFETPDGRVRAEALEMDDINTWALRYVSPDLDVPGRDWIIEVSSIVKGEQALFSCRMTLFSMDKDFAKVPQTPDVLRTLCDTAVFQSYGHRLIGVPREIGKDLSVTELLKQLTSTDRWWNCIVVSHAATHLDPGALQSGLAGVANVFILPNNHEMEFAAAVGYDFTLEPGGARVYRPGFDTLYSEVTRHPAIRATDTRPGSAIRDDLAVDAFALSVARKNVRLIAPSLTSIRQLNDINRSAQARESGDEPAQIEALQQLVKTEQRNVNEAIALAVQTDEERQSAQDALSNEQAINHGLRQRIETLEQQLQTLGGKTETKAPETYADVKRWVTENFSGKLRLTPRAEKGLRDARYEKLQDVVAGLRLLANDYRGMKMGATNPQDFDVACRGLGFEETRSVSKVTAGQHGDTYFVIYAGKRQFMDRHLKKGTAKDERHCLRIYFFWDAANEIVVVGSLPSHLTV